MKVWHVNPIDKELPEYDVTEEAILEEQKESMEKLLSGSIQCSDNKLTHNSANFYRIKRFRGLFRKVQKEFIILLNFFPNPFRCKP